MDPRELQDLQRLLKKASDAGLVDGNLTTKKAGGKSVNVQQASSSGAVTDASKRRLVEQEVQDDDWSSVDPLESMPVLPTDVAIEDDLKKRNFIPKDVWASIYSDIDDSVAIPEDMRDVYQWGRVRIGMDKYASLKISCEKAVAMAKSGDPDMRRYLTFIKNKYGKMTGDTQAFGRGKFLLKNQIHWQEVWLCQGFGGLVWIRPSAICMDCCCNVSNRSFLRTACWICLGDLSMAYVHGTSMISCFCEYQGHFGADAFRVSIEFDEYIMWFLLVSGSLR